MHSDKTKSTYEYDFFFSSQKYFYLLIENSDTSAPIWDKGKTGPLSQYASHILRDEPRRAFDVN